VTASCLACHGALPARARFCPACRASLPEGARFCPACGTRLEASAPEAAERKVVTTLFADIVGFTALGERHDPEDIDAALRGFYGLARTIVERYGGVVEKYIGDAVVGLLGVPLAHEDDAERAVRAALDLVAHMRELPEVGGERLQVRCAVNTGPALVRLDARPETGEGVLVGDAVNTCARLLSEAPAMGVVAGEMTQRLSARAIAYEELPAVAAKGKAEPVRRWLARGQRAQRGMFTGSLAETPMVGREVELATLDALLAKAIASSTPQFVVVSGEAGIGKSRLVGELYRLIDERPEFFVQWRQGHCPPYGEDLAFWALREIVLAHVGVVRSDDTEAIEAKLDVAFGDGPYAAPLLERLRPVVGLRAESSSSEDSFAVWESAFEAIASSKATVLVVEDLHWASRPTLDFLDHYAGTAASLPLLVVVTARPEFLEEHPDVLAPDAHVTRLPLKALTPDEIRRLAAALPGSSEPVLVDTLVESCGGNPLFAEELARHLAEGGQESPERRSPQWSDAPGPESISALIEARLDALPPDERNLLADASVVGRVFWPGALAAIGARDSTSLQASLDSLEAREFLRLSSDSLQPGEVEYTFWHALTRDAAYGRLPRAVRAIKHDAVADWMAQTTGSATGPTADLVAHHRWTALELARAAGLPDEVARLRKPAVEALVTAGDLALALDVTSAERGLSRAVTQIGRAHV
jgi:class 3 adenylate cyclase